MSVRILVVIGPTASGKTRLGVEVAHRLGSEILSADSRQTYRGLNIGSGKDLDEYQQVEPPVSLPLDRRRGSRPDLLVVPIPARLLPPARHEESRATLRPGCPPGDGRRLRTLHRGRPQGLSHRRRPRGRRVTQILDAAQSRRFASGTRSARPGTEKPNRIAPVKSESYARLRSRSMLSIMMCATAVRHRCRSTARSSASTFLAMNCGAASTSGSTNGCDRD